MGTITGNSTNECNIITLTPLTIECSVVQPLTISDGIVSVSVFGGTQPYLISWNDLNLINSTPTFSNNFVRSGLPAGTYTAVVVDYYSDFTATTTCVLTASTTTTTTSTSTSTTTTTTIAPPPTPVLRLSISKNDPVCGCDGSLTIIAADGVAPYTYSIDNGNTFKNSPTFNGLCAGLYSVSVVDSLKDTSNSSINLLNPPTSIQYSVSLNKNTRVISNNGITYTKVTDLSLLITPSLPNGAYITFDLIHNNIFKSSPSFSAASLTTNTTLTKNSTIQSISLSGTSTGSTINTTPGCQNEFVYISTYSENWSNLQINNTDNYSLTTTSTITKNININCYLVDDTDTYYISNLKINNCPCCSIQTII